MARRSDHSRDQLAQMVIEAARAITLKDGWRAVTMRGIAGRIGYAAGSIYNAVGDIDAVLLRVNADTLERLAAKLDAASRGDGEARVLALADAYMTFVAAHAPLWSALMERPPPAQAPDWYAGPRARLLDIVAAAVSPFYPDPKSCRRAVLALWAALQGVAALSAGGNLAFAGKFEPRDIARSIVKRYLSGRE